VDGWLVEHSPELTFQLASQVVPCQPGLQFGSRYVIDPMHGHVLDYLPETMIGQVRNLETFAGILALDKWTCNADGRQAAFWKKLREKKYTAAWTTKTRRRLEVSMDRPNAPSIAQSAPPAPRMKTKRNRATRSRS